MLLKLFTHDSSFLFKIPLHGEYEHTLKPYQRCKEWGIAYPHFEWFDVFDIDFMWLIPQSFSNPYIFVVVY